MNAALYVQNELDVDLIQLGALTTSVTDGGVWITKQKEYTGYVNHGDSYTAAVTCQTVLKALNFFNKKSTDQVLAIVGAYGVIGEAVSKILVPQFKHSILVGRREEKLQELKKLLKGNFETTTDLETNNAEIVVTATSHLMALLNSNHLKENAIIVDVSQPPVAYPERIQTLTLIAPAYQMSEMKATTDTWVHEMEQLGSLEFHRREVRKMFPVGTDPTLLEWQAQQMAAVSADVVRSFMAFTQTINNGELLSKIQAPTLLIVPKKSDRFPTTEAEFMRQRIPDVRVVSFDVPHNLMLSIPVGLPEAILDFLREHRGNS